MSKFLTKLLLAAFMSSGYTPSAAQELPPTAALEVSGRIRIGKKQEKLQRKRFHLLRGGLEENKVFVERLKSAEILSRDCFYTQSKASPQYICWLKKENCESPYCRAITDEDIEYVPEFMSAYRKGLRQFGRSRSHIARDWLTTNLPPLLREGFFKRQGTLLNRLLGEVRPVQSTMTDSVSVKAIFIDIPLLLSGPGGAKKESETFLVTNILPFEIGDKSYLWACQVDLSAGQQSKLILKVPDDDKPVKDCEVIVKDLPVCQTQGCKE